LSAVASAKEKTVQELGVTLPDHKVKYLESMSKYIAETVSEIIEGLGYNHLIRHFEIIDGEHRQNIKSKPFANHRTKNRISPKNKKIRLLSLFGC